jgi:hypothetical protein
MNSELSSLQKEILHLALERNFVTYAEIFTELWGWQPQEWGSIKVSVGKRAYATGHASLSRSISRLWQRGLVTIWKNLTNSATAISLTAPGAELAGIILTKIERKQGDG